MPTLIIDRFEGDIAVCERPDKSFTDISRSLLPAEAKEGDVMRRGAEGLYQLDSHATQIKADRIAQKMNTLWK